MKNVCIQNYSGPHFPAFGHSRMVRIRENADKNNSCYGHFLRSEIDNFPVIFRSILRDVFRALPSIFDRVLINPLILYSQLRVSTCSKCFSANINDQKINLFKVDNGNNRLILRNMFKVCYRDARKTSLKSFWNLYYSL